VRVGLAAALSAVPGGERGHCVGRDVVEPLRGVGDHGDPVAFDRQRRDPDAEVDRRDAELGQVAVGLGASAGLSGGEEHQQGPVALLRITASAGRCEVAPVMFAAEHKRDDVVD
jgi:hypothetical protein